MATVAMVVAIALGATGCGFEEAPKPPNAQEAVEALNALVADREGMIDSRGRYKGPRVLKASDLKCNMTDEKSRTYRCSLKYSVKRRNTEEEAGTHSFRKIPVKFVERGKEVERKAWRVVGS